MGQTHRWDWRSDRESRRSKLNMSDGVTSNTRVSKSSLSSSAESICLRISISLTLGNTVVGQTNTISESLNSSGNTNAPAATLAITEVCLTTLDEWASLTEAWVQTYLVMSLNSSILVVISSWANQSFCNNHDVQESRNASPSHQLALSRNHEPSQTV